MNNAPLPFSFPVPHGQFFVFLWPVLFLQCASLIKKVLKFVWSHLFFLYRLPCVFYWSCKRFKVAWFVYVTKLFTQRFTVIYTSKLVWLTFLCGTQTMLETYSLSHHSLYCKMLWTWMGVLLTLQERCTGLKQHENFHYGVNNSFLIPYLLNSRHIGDIFK